MTSGRSPDVTRLLAGVALAAFIVGLGIAVVRGLDGNGTTQTSIPTAALPEPKPKPRPTKRSTLAPFVKLAAVGAFDPEGDGRERDEDAPLAVDGRADTAWRTERYSHFFKTGVGLVLDLGRRLRVERVVVTSPAPGARAEIRLGDAREGPFAEAASAQTLGATTRFTIPRRPARYVVVWFVGLRPESAGEISEVRVRAQ